MLDFAIFGITNSGISLALELVLLFLVVIWFALVYWTYADACRRISDPLLIGCATAASLFPFVGTIVYMIVRPPEFLDDVRERELEMQAAEARLAELGYHLCPHCDHEVERDFLRCPHCMRKLKDPCHNCGKPLDPSWRVCPYCEAEIGGAAAGPRRVRRRRDGVSEPQAAAGGRREGPVGEPQVASGRRDGASEPQVTARRREGSAEPTSRPAEPTSRPAEPGSQPGSRPPARREPIPDPTKRPPRPRDGVGDTVIPGGRSGTGEAVTQAGRAGSGAPVAPATRGGTGTPAERRGPSSG